MKWKEKYCNDKFFPNSYRKIIETETKLIPRTDIYMTAHFPSLLHVMVESRVYILHKYKSCAYTVKFSSHTTCAHVSNKNLTVWACYSYIQIWRDNLTCKRHLKYYGFERTWWRLFRRPVVRTKFDIYVFIKIYSYSKAKFSFLQIEWYGFWFLIQPLGLGMI